MKEIILNNILNANAVTLSGRSEGTEARKYFKLDLKDNDNEHYKIIIPKRIRTFNISYFLGMFSLSVVKLKEEKFREKYIFKSENNEDVAIGVKLDIDEGIEWALEETSILE